MHARISHLKLSSNCHTNALGFLRNIAAIWTFIFTWIVFALFFFYVDPRRSTTTFLFIFFLLFLVFFASLPRLASCMDVSNLTACVRAFSKFLDAKSRKCTTRSCICERSRICMSPNEMFDEVLESDMPTNTHNNTTPTQTKSVTEHNRALEPFSAKHSGGYISKNWCN
jgi:hypothetical protein